MAKDDRQILHGIRSPVSKEARKSGRSQLFKPGMEDELAQALTQQQLDDAVERGDLSGTWKHIGPAKAAPAAKAK